MFLALLRNKTFSANYILDLAFLSILSYPWILGASFLFHPNTPLLTPIISEVSCVAKGENKKSPRWLFYSVLYIKG